MKRIIYKKGRHKFYLFTGIAGLVLLYWVVPVYRLTFIPLWIPVALTVLVGGMVTAINYRHFGATYNLHGKFRLLLAATWNLVSWGFLACAALMMTNYYLRDEPVARKEFEIVSRHALPGDKDEPDNLKPIFKVRYKGLSKELVFEHRFYKWKDDYKSVILGLQEGYWGFDVIRSKALTK